MTDAISDATKVLYREKQWVPWYWWFLAAFIVALTTAQLAHNRSILWIYIPAAILTAAAAWVLLSLSSTVVTVEEDSDGVRWLGTRNAILPHTVV